MTATIATPAAAPADRYFAARSAGRYRVFERMNDGTEVELAVVASKAKGEEKVAKLVAAAEAELEAAYAAKVAAEDAARAEQEAFAAELAADKAAMGSVEDYKPETAAPEADAPEADAAAPAAPAFPASAKPADKLLSVWVGHTVVELVVPRVEDEDAAVAAVAAKLRDRTPDGANARTIRVNAAERAALSALATEVENQATTDGNGRLARAARALRGRLA